MNFSYPMDSIAAYEMLDKLLISPQKRETYLINTRIVILSCSAYAEIAEFLTQMLRDYDLKANIKVENLPSNFTTDFTLNENLKNFAPDIVVIHTSINDIKKPKGYFTTYKQVDKIFEADRARFEWLWTMVHDTLGCKIVQNNFELPPFRDMGSKSAANGLCTTNYCSRMNQMIYDFENTHSWFHIHDINYLSAYRGLETWYGTGDNGGYIMSRQMLPEFAFNLTAIIKSLLQKNKKALVIYLDTNILDEIKNSYNAYMFNVQMCTYLRDLMKSGVYIALCSSCHESAVDYCFSSVRDIISLDMLDFVKCSCTLSSDLLYEIATVLSIFTNNMIVVYPGLDASLCKSRCEELEAQQLVSVSSRREFINAIDRGGFFEVTELNYYNLTNKLMDSFSKEKEELLRTVQLESDFAEQLQIQITAHKIELSDVDLLYNFCHENENYSLTDMCVDKDTIDVLLREGDQIGIFFSYEDINTDIDIIAYVIGKVQNNILSLNGLNIAENMVGLGIEGAIFKCLCDICVSKGIEYVHWQYVQGKKNEGAQYHYQTLGIGAPLLQPDGKIYAKLNTEMYYCRSNSIKINNEYADTVLS